MPAYHVPYAQEHLEDLFEEARTGEVVIILRFDGRSCQLLPLADVKSRTPLTKKKVAISDLELPGSLVPA
jgi:hypothetical protein